MIVLIIVSAASDCLILGSDAGDFHTQVSAARDCLILVCERLILYSGLCRLIHILDSDMAYALGRTGFKQTMI